MAVNWRRNLYALFAAQMLAIVAFSLRAPFLPFYLSDLGATSTDAQTLWSGIINASGAGVMAITAPFWGTIADRYGRKPMLVRAMVAAVITIALMSLATEVWHLLALRLIEGSLTGTVTAATALVAAGTPKDRLGYGLGLIQTAVFSGASLGPLAGGFLGDQIGYRATFWIASVMMGSAAAIVIFFVREQFTPQQRVTTGSRGGFGVWSLVTGRVLLTMIIAMTVIRLASSAVQPIMPLFVEQLAHAASGTASTLSGITLGIAGVTSAISAIVLGRLGDRAGHRRILLWSTLAAGLLYFPMAAAQAPWHLIVLQALFGFAAGGLIPAANALIANHTPPDRRGAVYGMVAAAQSAGGFIGPLAGSVIAASLGFPIALCLTGALLLGLTAGLAYSDRADRADRSNAPNPSPAGH